MVCDDVYQGFAFYFFLLEEACSRVTFAVECTSSVLVLVEAMINFIRGKKFFMWLLHVGMNGVLHADSTQRCYYSSYLLLLKFSLMIL